MLPFPGTSNGPIAAAEASLTTVVEPPRVTPRLCVQDGGRVRLDLLLPTAARRLPPPRPAAVPQRKAAGALGRCAICLEGDMEDDEFQMTEELLCNWQHEGCWGYTVCCKATFHTRCLEKQATPRRTGSGTADVSTACPSCRGELRRSKRRMVNRGDETPRRTESLKEQRAQLGLVDSEVAFRRSSAWEAWW